MEDMNGTLEEILKALPNGSFLKADGLDEAVIGLEGGIRVYSKDKCTEILMSRDGMDRDEAVEFLYFNTYGAFVGEKTPIFRYDDEIENAMCKKYLDSEVLPDEDDNCSLCGGDCTKE